MKNDLSIADEMAAEINKEARAVALNVLRGVVMATPVDTGRAKGNWFVGINRKRNDRELMRRALDAMNDGLAVFAMVKKQYKIYPDINITNNLDYIERLNDGHSKQAPRFFVEQVINRAVK